MPGGDDYETLQWPHDFSDGDPSKWPGVGSGLAPADTTPTAQTWLRRTGQTIATILGREGQTCACLHTFRV
jgi:hypothetical protein